MNQTQDQTRAQAQTHNGMDRDAPRATAVEQSEGTVAKTIEQQTAKLPSDLFLWAAIGAIGTAAVLEFSGKHDKSQFVGQWVAPFLLFGVYNKLVKVAGSDRLHR